MPTRLELTITEVEPDDINWGRFKQALDFLDDVKEVRSQDLSKGMTLIMKTEVDLAKAEVLRAKIAQLLGGVVIVQPITEQNAQ